MLRIDIDEVLREKMPRRAKYIPRFVRQWLRRTIHEEELNRILEEGQTASPREFIRIALHYMRVNYTVEGLERLDTQERYLFVANHPFGGMDGMMIAAALIDRFGDVRVVINDLLMHVEPLRPIWLPVNKHGRQTPEYVRQYDEAFYGDVPLLTFPAGLCSRRRNGVVSDTEWRLNFIKRAHASRRKIVPLYVEGQLSDFFYRMARFRERIGIRTNIEMLWLPDEMFRQSGSSLRIAAGEPVAPEELTGTLRQQADAIREAVYRLKDRLSCPK